MNLARRLLKIVAILAGIAVVVILAFLAYASAFWDAKVDRGVRELTASRDPATVARGEFLFKSSLTCWGCHGSEYTGTAPPSGGMKFDLTRDSPSLGVYYASNITPDVETGIGAWSDGEIVRAIREGISRDGRVLFPVMPVDPLNGLSDDDVLALVAYMRSIPPVRNRVPEREPSLFAKILFSTGGVGPMKERSEPVVAPERAITRAYGEYVTMHASLCSDCHTPRNLQTGEFYYDSVLAGGSIRLGEDTHDPVIAYASNITPDPETGIGTWTEDQFLSMMQMGVGPDGKVRTIHMPYAYYGLWDSLELKAVYQFVKSLKPIRRQEPPLEFLEEMLSNEPLIRGKGVFNSYCVDCHGDSGKGAMPTNVAMADVAPSLSDADLIDFIMNGNPGLRMPGFSRTLSNEDLRAVVTYIRSWDEEAM